MQKRKLDCDPKKQGNATQGSWPHTLSHRRPAVPGCDETTPQVHGTSYEMSSAGDEMQMNELVVIHPFIGALFQGQGDL